MPSRKFVPLAGLALGLLLDPAYAEENTLELDTISVTSDAYESATGPVDGYRATRSASATKTDTALRDIKDLVDRGILVKDDGGGRSTSYSLVDRG